MRTATGTAERGDALTVDALTVHPRLLRAGLSVAAQMSREGPVGAVTCGDMKQ
ncbi:hypothetical protein [Streptomyces sp. NPDC002491]